MVGIVDSRRSAVVKGCAVKIFGMKALRRSVAFGSYKKSTYLLADIDYIKFIQGGGLKAVSVFKAGF